jgi:hypothetical protein
VRFLQSPIVVVTGQVAALFPSNITSSVPAGKTPAEAPVLLTVLHDVVLFQAVPTFLKYNGITQ